MNKIVKWTVAAFLGVAFSSCSETTEKCDVQESGLSSREAVIDNIMSRRSVRKFKEEQVPMKVLDSIIVCGINAPNAKNQQAYEVKVVTDSASTAFLSENLDGLYKAPVYMFFANDTQYNSSLIDVGLMSENICLSAWSFGIGTVNMGFPARDLSQKPEILEKFGFGENYQICLVLALGYPDEAPDAKPRSKDKVQFVKF